MSSRPGGGRAPPQQAPPVINLEGYLEKRIRVRFAGGREGAFAVNSSRGVAMRGVAGVGARWLPHFCVADPSPLYSAVVGLLKGFDGLVNIVLDDAVEYLRGACGCLPCMRVRVRLLTALSHAHRHRPERRGHVD